MTPTARRLASAATVAAASIAALSAALLIFAQAASAQSAPDVQQLRTRSLAASCAQCHGTDGRAADGAAVPGLAGMPASDLVQRMNAFKSGERAGTVMPQLAKGFSDAQIERLANYFANPVAVPTR